MGFSAIITKPMATTQDFVNWVCGPELEPDYLLYAFRSMSQEFERLRFGSVHNTIYMPDVRRLEIPRPPIHEQRAIVSLLREALPKINDLIAKKRRLIELLQEERQALITQAVTKGLDPNKPPARLGYYVDLLPGFAFPSEGFVKQGVRLLRGINVAPGRLRWDDTQHWLASDTEALSRYELRPGDLVFGMDRPWVSGGVRVAEVRDADLPALLLQRVARLRARWPLHQGYLKLILSSREFQRHFEPILTGISVPHVSGDQILAYRCSIPTPEVQQKVSAEVEAEFARMGTLETSLERSVDKLKEYRQALISAEVTGKIDIHVPEEAKA